MTRMATTAAMKILVAVAKKMAHWMREKDVLARWGGEEFLILLSDTDVESATEQAERLRTAIEGQDFAVQIPGNAPDR